MSKCYCETSVCNPCMIRLEDDLHIIAGRDGAPLMDELEVTTTRQSNNPGMRLSVSQSKDETPILFNQRSSDATDGLKRTMRTVRWMMQGAYPHINCVTSHPTDVARWLLLIPGLIEDHPGSVHIVSSIRLSVDSALNAIDNAPTRVFVGWCPSCGQNLFAESTGDPTDAERLVKCCGRAETVRDLRARLFDKLSSTYVTPAQSVGLVTTVTGEAVVNPESLKRKIRKKLTGELGYYRFTEVLALVDPDGWGRGFVTDVTDTGA